MQYECTANIRDVQYKTLEKIFTHTFCRKESEWKERCFQVVLGTHASQIFSLYFSYKLLLVNEFYKKNYFMSEKYFNFYIVAVIVSFILRLGLEAFLQL